MLKNVSVAIGVWTDAHELGVQVAVLLKISV